MRAIALGQPASLRRGRGGGCGKKGPPLAPFVRVPALVTTVTPQRVGDDVYLSFTVPDDQRRRPEARRHRRGRGLRGHLAIGRPPPRSSASWRRWSRRCRCGRSCRSCRCRRTVPRRRRFRCRPVSIAAPRSRFDEAADRRGARAGGAAGREAGRRDRTGEPKTRRSASVRWSRRRRRSCRAATTSWSRRARAAARACRRRRCRCRSKPAAPRPGSRSSPTPPADMTITWTPSPDARTVDVPAAADGEAGRRRQRHAGEHRRRSAAPLPPLAAKSLGFNTEATTYHVYDVTPPSTRRTGSAYAITLPKPITPAPVARHRVRDQGRGVRRRALLRSAAGRQRVRQPW